MLKRSFIVVLLCLCLLWLSACIPQKELIVVEADEAATLQETQTPSPTITATPTTQPAAILTTQSTATPTSEQTAVPTIAPTEPPAQTHNPPKSTQTPTVDYLIEDKKLYKQIADVKTLLYDPAAYYETAPVFIRELFVEKSALYFIEGTVDPEQQNDPNIRDFIIRIDKDGGNRQVLVTSTAQNGFQEFITYQDRIIFWEEHGDSVDMGDVAKDGSDQGRLDIKAYTDQYNAFTSFGHVEFEKRDGYLFVHVRLYPKEDDLDELHTIRINEHFTITRVLPE